MMTKKILYFDTASKSNTEATLKAALERAKELGLKDIVVASSTGATGVLACEIFKGFKVTVVTTQVGIIEPGVRQLTDENEKKILELGGKILTCTHALAGAERAIRTKWNTMEPVEIIAQALKIFGQAAKVCVETVIMTADAGSIPLDRAVIAVAGTNRGADTAFVVKPVHANNLFSMVVREIICKPRGPMPRPEGSH